MDRVATLDAEGMAGDGRQWSLSNPGPNALLLWIEPWAEEFDVPVRSTVMLKAPGAADEGSPGDVEWTPDHLVVWANAPTVQVYIDDQPQESASAVIPIPDGLTKGILNVIFAAQPGARLAGAPDDGEQTSWWRRAKRFMGI